MRLREELAIQYLHHAIAAISNGALLAVLLTPTFSLHLHSFNQYPFTPITMDARDHSFIGTHTHDFARALRGRVRYSAVSAASPGQLQTPVSHRHWSAAPPAQPQTPVSRKPWSVASLGHTSSIALPRWRSLDCASLAASRLCAPTCSDSLQWLRARFANHLNLVQRASNGRPIPLRSQICQYRC